MSSKRGPTPQPNLDGESRSAHEAESRRSERDSFWSSEAVSGSSERAEAYPVFVLGAARSGTTAVSVALKSATRYRGFPEGHVLDVAIRLIDAVDGHFEKKDSWISPQASSIFQLGQVGHASLRVEMIEVLRRLASGYTTPYWFDKTPTHQMVASVPILAEAWPNARFIFMKRRGLENMCSWLRKFNRQDFSIGCQNWALAMSTWRMVRESVPHKFVELDQHSLLEDAEESAAGVGRLLRLNALEVEAFAAALRRARPEVTDPSARIFSDVSELGWPAERLNLFRDLCGAEMEAYGYTYDTEYCR